MVGKPQTLRAGSALLGEMLLLLAVTGLLWLFHLYGLILAEPVMAAIWALLALPIALGLFWRARVRRRAFLHACIAPQSPLQRWLRGGWLLLLRQVLLAALLALALAVALLRLEDARVWLVLMGCVPLLVLTQALARRRLARHVAQRYLAELSWRVTLPVTGAALLAAVVTLALHHPHPDFSEVSLERAVWHMVEQEQARSAAAEMLLQLAAAKDALRLWLAQQLMPVPGDSLAQLAAWLIVLAEGAVFVWSYLLLCSGVLLGMNADDRATR